MEKTSLFITIFIFSLIISITLFSIRQGFGKSSKNFIDPFEENEN